MLNGHLDYTEANKLEWIVMVRGSGILPYTQVEFASHALVFNSIIVCVCVCLSPFALSCVDPSSPVCHSRDRVEHHHQGHPRILPSFSLITEVSRSLG